LSAENGRWEEAKIASLCRVLGFRLRPPDKLRVGIDVHGRWVIDNVVLRFLRETVRADAFHCCVQHLNTEKGAKGKVLNRPGRPLPCAILREDRLERVGTESRPYLYSNENHYFSVQRRIAPLDKGYNGCSLRNLAVFGITPTATAVYSPTVCVPSSSGRGCLSFLFTTLSSILFVGTRSPSKGWENGLSGRRFSSSGESSLGALLLNALSMDNWPPRVWIALPTDSGRTYPGYSME
jgi:hypothetical protein